MRKIKLLIIVVVCLFVVNVKADMGPPVVAKHEVMVTNKDGAACYDNGKKTGKVLPYGKTYEVSDDINGSYLTIYMDSDSCTVKYSDVSAKTQSFSLNNEDVEKITSVRAIVLAKGGLNMRKGPSVTYSKIITIPQYSIITISYKAGSYWYYCDYNGKQGWITGMDGYFAYDGKEVLVNYEDTKIYSAMDRKKVVGTIPANTEITNYINLVTRSRYDISHYVIYNGVKGYTERMMYKTNGTGKIKLIKDYDVTNEDGETLRKLTANQELTYEMENSDGSRYFIEKKFEGYIAKDYYEVVNKVDFLTKKSGYIGEGLYGEKKEEVKPIDEPTATPTSDEPKQEENNKKDSKMSSKDIIIICLLGGIFLALTAIVIIKLLNNKKKVPVTILNEDNVRREPPKEESYDEPKHVKLDEELNNVKVTKEDDDKEV